MSPIVVSIFAVLLISFISLIGVFTIGASKSFLKKITLLLVSLAAGALIGSALFQILPELIEVAEHGAEEGLPLNLQSVGIIIVTGILIFFVLEKILHWNHCHRGISNDHNHTLAIQNVFADGLHNFVDGLIIATSFTVSTELGIATTVAIALHEIPQEIGDFGILIHSGLSRTKALLVNFGTALAALLGVLVVAIFGEVSEMFSFVVLGIAAGGFLYIAIADLIPEIKHEDNTAKSVLQLIIFTFGVAVMLLVSLLAPHSHAHEGDDDHEDEIEHVEEV